MAARSRHDFVASAVLTAAQMDALPAGWLAYKIQSSSQGSITTAETTITDLTETATVGNNRVLRFAAEVSVESTVADCQIRLRLKKDTDVQVAADFNLGSGTGFAHRCHLERILTVATGASFSWSVTIERLSGSGTLTVTASSNTPGVLALEDLGST